MEVYYTVYLLIPFLYKTNTEDKTNKQYGWQRISYHTVAAILQNIMQITFLQLPQRFFFILSFCMQKNVCL